MLKNWIEFLKNPSIYRKVQQKNYKTKNIFLWQAKLFIISLNYQANKNDQKNVFPNSFSSILTIITKISPLPFVKSKYQGQAINTQVVKTNLQTKRRLKTWLGERRGISKNLDDSKLCKTSFVLTGFTSTCYFKITRPKVYKFL